MAKSMGMAALLGVMERPSTGNGNQTKCMAMAFSNCLMGGYMRESIKTIENMEKESSPTQMAGAKRACGKMGNKLGL
jgi:hypothetical protein